MSTSHYVRLVPSMGVDEPCPVVPSRRGAPEWIARLGGIGLGALLGVTSTGCGLCGDVVCGACPAPLTLRVTDAEAGGMVAELTVSGAEALCDVPAGAALTSCDVQVPVGTTDLVLSAPGYDDEPVSVTINGDTGESCCSCGYNSKIIDVAMTPTS